MKIFLVTLLLVLFLFLNYSCKQKEWTNSHMNSKTRSILNDTSRWTLLQSIKSNESLSNLDTGSNISQEEIEKTINLWLNSLEQNDSQLFENNNYRLQFKLLSKFDQEKEILVNCFCGNDFPKWKTKLVLSYNGDNCFFFKIVNLKRTTISKIFKVR